MFTLQHYVGFCHTVWISRKYECPLPPEPYPTPPLHPILLDCHRLQEWAPCVIQQLSISYLFNIWTSQMVLVVKNLPTNTGDIGDTDFIPGLGRCPGGGHSNPLQYSSLENPMDKGAWQVTVNRVAKSQTWLKGLSSTQCIFSVLLSQVVPLFPVPTVSTRRPSISASLLSCKWVHQYHFSRFHRYALFSFLFLTCFTHLTDCRSIHLTTTDSNMFLFTAE